jgi:hypothetical protein
MSLCPIVVLRLGYQLIGIVLGIRLARANFRVHLATFLEGGKAMRLTPICLSLVAVSFLALKVSAHSTAPVSVHTATSVSAGSQSLAAYYAIKADGFTLTHLKEDLIRYHPQIVKNLAEHVGGFHHLPVSSLRAALILTNPENRAIIEREAAEEDEMKDVLLH